MASKPSLETLLLCLGEMEHPIEGALWPPIFQLLGSPLCG